MENVKKRSLLIIFFAWLAYLLSYLGRSDYSACILEIINETGVSRATAGMVSSTFALCNAFGQLATGFVLKKISPVKLISAELFTVAAINLLFPNINSFILIALLWGINGCMQATLLCSATKIFVENLQEPYLSKGVVWLNTIGAIGGAINYVLSFVLIKYANWKTVFITVATLLLLFGILWVIIMPKLTKISEQPISQIPAGPSNKPAKTAALLSQITHYGTIFAVLGAFFIGLLRESVSLWIPSYMNEMFGLSSSASTIITMFVPCLQVCGALLGGQVGTKARNLHFPSCAAFLISGTCLFLLPLFGKMSAVLSLVFFILNAICMTAALTFLLSLFPIRFFGKGQAPILVGIINFLVHAGDFFASSGIGWLSQTGGWRLTFGTLSGLAFLAAIVCGIGGIICQKEVQK